MGKKILIVDAGCTNYGKGGTLSHAFAALAKETLEGLGHTVDREFDPQAEAVKIAAADSLNNPRLKARSFLTVRSA